MNCTVHYTDGGVDLDIQVYDHTTIRELQEAVLDALRRRRIAVPKKNKLKVWRYYDARTKVQVDNPDYTMVCFEPPLYETGVDMGTKPPARAFQ